MMQILRSVPTGYTTSKGTLVHRPATALIRQRLVGQARACSSGTYVPREDSTHAPKLTQGELDFRDTKTAYQSKGFGQLLRSYVVFRLCSYQTILNHQKQILNVTRTLLGRRLFRGLMNLSIYGQFIAGEEREDILGLADSYYKHGVRPMFAYTTSESHGAAEGMVGSETDEIFFKANYEAMKMGIHMSSQASRGRNEYVKISCKYTFFGPASLFRVTTKLIDGNTRLVSMALSSQESGWSPDYRRRFLTALEEVVTSSGEGTLTQVAQQTGLPIPSNFRSIDWRSLTTSLTFHLALMKNKAVAALLKELPLEDVGHLALSAEEENQLLRIWDWIDDLAKQAAESGVCLWMDAEQTYLQSAMDLLTLDLMRRYNSQRPVVHNTYQCYLRRTYDVITRDLASASAEGFILGLKVVRGGYMDEERQLAAKHHYADPVNPTFEATTAMYYRCAEELLSRLAAGNALQVTFATHNEDTVKHVLTLIKEHGVDPDPNQVAFGQLLGMRDHVTFILGAAGLPAKKLLHYGQIDDCVAYLSRRITENRSGVPTAEVERSMLGKEIWRRLRRA